MKKGQLLEADIIQKLLAKDKTAVAALYRFAYHPLLLHLKTKFPREDETLFWDCISDSFLKLSDQPTLYKPSNKSLLSYLKMDVEGDVRNALAKRQRRQKNEKVQGHLVELQGMRREDINRKNPENLLLEDELKNRLSGKIKKILKDDTDCRIAEMMLTEKVRQTEEYAAILDVHHLPPTEQAAIVKRRKDKIKAKIKRSDWENFLNQIGNEYQL